MKQSFKLPPPPQPRHKVMRARWRTEYEVGQFYWLSNLGFLVIGIYGLLVRGRARATGEDRIFQVLLSVAMILIAFGSAYFHWYPTVATL